MKCYLCGRNSARVLVESSSGETYTVCGVCDERGVYCDSCDKPLKGGDDQHEILGAWDSPTGRFNCETCAEGAYERYQEMVMS